MEPKGQVWDALVVGAGPAGCAAAFDLAAGGASVLLVDRSDFPRHKPCAGGLTMKALRTLRYPIDPVVRRTLNSVRLERGGSRFPLPFSNRKEDRFVLLKSRDPICVMTVRSELDAFCLRQTIGAGASFRRISAIRQVACSADGVSLITERERLPARFLIGADGATSQVRLLCSGGSWFSRGFALEVEVSSGEADCDLSFDFGAVPHGYGWIFPKGDHVNVGLYCDSSVAFLTRSRLIAYVKAKLGTDVVNRVTGHHLGIGAWRYRSEDMQGDLRSRVFLVGDAAGFADPLTGEGIYGALASGQAAATAILAELHQNGLAGQTFARQTEPYRKLLAFSARAADAFYMNPDRGFQALRFPVLRRRFIKTYSDGLSPGGLAMRIALSHC